MCSRFTLRTPQRILMQQFGLTGLGVKPHYNIAPTQIQLVVVGNPRQAVSLRWGMVSPLGQSLINTRCESFMASMGDREPLKKQRCLVLADGFYEWKTTGSICHPYFVSFKHDGPFAFAGLWDREAFTILTTSSNELLMPLHGRMPAILDRDRYDAWLDEATPVEQLAPFLQPHSSATMRVYAVGHWVNNPFNDDPSCLTPRGPEMKLPDGLSS